ncbi:MAG: flagellar biosynthetic protein FliQ [Phycisphaerales bacterium]
MSEYAPLEIVRESLMIAMKISFPILVSGVLIGLMISIAQSVTQIQEQTLTVVPKLFAMLIVAIILLPWLVSKLMDFAIQMFSLF